MDAEIGDWQFAQDDSAEDTGLTDRVAIIEEQLAQVLDVPAIDFGEGQQVRLVLFHKTHKGGKFQCVLR